MDDKTQILGIVAQEGPEALAKVLENKEEVLEYLLDFINSEDGEEDRDFRIYGMALALHELKERLE